MRSWKFKSSRSHQVLIFIQDKKSAQIIISTTWCLFYGALAERLRRGLQNLLDEFDSRTCLQELSIFHKLAITSICYTKYMPSSRSWTDEQLIIAAQGSVSIREVIKKLGLVPAGGNYTQINARIDALGIDRSHFTGKAWNKGKKYHISTRPALDRLLQRDSAIQSHKLKKRLYEEGLKTPKCELCGWAKMSIDGRIPLELDHINGDHADNRLENLRILCPNCHSLQPTHRGRNKKTSHARMLE